MARRGRLIVVSNRLPFRKKVVNGKDTWVRSPGGLVTAIDPVMRERGGVWVGWSAESKQRELFHAPESLDRMRREQEPVSRIGRGGSYRICVLPLHRTEIEEYYNRFSNSILWPLFHYFFEECEIAGSGWKYYRDVNEKFAETIASVARPGDTVWVQDYHLMMVPLFLRRKAPRLRVHFFLHIPFPHSDVLSILPWHRHILESLLCCRSVGFHTRTYLQNFITCIKVLLGFEASRRRGEIVIGKRVVRAYAQPIGVDFDKYNVLARQERMQKRAENLKKEIGCDRLIVSVDRLDYSKGIPERLFALEKFYAEFARPGERVAFYQVAAPSREGVSKYRELKRTVDELSGRINSRFSAGGWVPVHYVYRTQSLHQLIPLFLAADAAMVTPLRDGMNLVCKEYVASRAHGGGVLVLSRFAGAAEELRDACLVNPYDIEGTAGALRNALDLDETEEKTRMRKLRRQVKKRDLTAWIRACENHLKP